MKNWLFIHRLLLGIAIAAIGVQLMVFVMILRPQ